MDFFAKIAGFVVLLIFFCLLGGCNTTHTSRFKVTVSVDDNGTIYSGSAVQEIIWSEPIRWLGSLSSGTIRIRGESIPVKIGDKGYLFMIFGGTNKLVDTEYYADYIRDRKMQNGVNSWDVSIENTPILVTFDNLNDPTSVKLVFVHDYDEIKYYSIPGRYRSGEIRTPVKANFNEIFGEGVTFKPVHVERVYFKPITRGEIEKILPWLTNLKWYLFDYKGGQGNIVPVERLQRDNFIGK